jgi:hypothetical protein
VERKMTLIFRAAFLIRHPSGSSNQHGQAVLINGDDQLAAPVQNVIFVAKAIACQLEAF